jgi:hypothetical protein
MNRDWIIEVREETARKGRFSWKAYRHRDGQKNVAEFGCLGKLKRFVKRHLFYECCRAFNRVTKEYAEL